jgi:hypothetical protein
MKNKILNKEIKVLDAITTPGELIVESVINFFWGFFGNSIVLFMTKEIDLAVFINFLLYYGMISYIINRGKYETYLGRMVVLPGSAAAGAFAGYKTAQWISLFL